MPVAPRHLAALLLLVLATPAGAEPQRFLHDTPTRRIDIQHRVVRVRFDFAKQAIEGRVTLSGAALDTLSSLALDARELTVASATDSTRGALPFVSDDARLTLRFPAPLARGERAAITIVYTARPRAGLYWVVPDAGHPGRRPEVWSQGEDESNRWWFPDFDEPAERASTEEFYTVPTGMFALGNGHLVETTPGPAAGETTFHWREDFPFVSYLVMVAASRYAKVDTTWRGIPVEYYVPPDKAERVARSMGRTPEMLEYFSSRLGVPYPYEKYAQVVVQDFTFGGMENLSATTLVERILLDQNAALERTQEGLVAHELGHQWFGDYITCREWAHAWLNEGFANFMADLWWEHAYGRDEHDRSLLDERASYFGSDGGGRRPMVEPNYRFADDLFDGQIYAHGAWILHMLRSRLGDDAFFRGMRGYLEANGGTSVDTDRFRHALEEASGVGLDGFFDHWTRRAGYPELTVSWEWAEARKLARVRVEQTQASDSLTPVFRFDLPVRLALKDHDVRVTLTVDGRHAETWVPLAERPRYVEVNDDLSVLCSVKFERKVTELSAQLADAPLAASRIEAARALGEKGTPAAIAALAKALSADRFYAVRQACAEGLAKVPTAEGLAAITPGLADADARVRRSVAGALGSFHGVDGAAVLARRALSDPVGGVNAEALGALARLGSPDAYERLVAGLARPSWNDQIETAALAGFADLGDTRAIPALIRATHAREPIVVRSSAVTALGRLGRWLPLEPAAGKTTRREVRLALEPLLWDGKMAVRRAAAGALGELGDRAALEALQRVVEREAEERVISAALQSQVRLSGSADGGVASLRSELEKLRDKNRVLELRVGAVEEALKK
jgi:aminopeptidase N